MHARSHCRNHMHRLNPINSDGLKPHRANPPKMKDFTNLAAPREVNKCIRIHADEVFLLGDLHIPEAADALVIFASASGRSRNNPRCLRTASAIRIHGIGTLLCELLTEEEEIEDQATEKFRDDAERMADRLVKVTQWAKTQPETKNLRIGYFGVYAGGAAALIAAARLGDEVHAVVSRSGRTDLATSYLPKVSCPTLLIAGENDPAGLQMNREALEHLRCEKRLTTVGGASRLFGEPGKLAEMAELGGEWFSEHLRHHPSHH